MRVERLRLRCAPGLPDGLPEFELPEGLVLVVGPNASGKSTLVRLIRTLLWPDGADHITVAYGHWRTTAGAHTVNLFAGQVRWDPTLQATAPPGGAALARFDLRSLLDDGDEHDRELAERLVQELAGGLDLAGARAHFERQEPRKLLREIGSAREDLRAENKRSAKLVSHERRLGELETELEVARAAGSALAAATALVDVVKAAKELAEIGARIDELPEGLDELRGNEAKGVEKLTMERVRFENDLPGLEEKITKATELRDTTAFPTDPPSEDDVETWTERLDVAADRERKAEQLRGELAAAEATRNDARARVAVESHGEDIQPEALDRLAAAIAAHREARAEHVGAVGVAEAWARWADDVEGDERALRDTVNALRAWLRAPAVVPGWVIAMLLAAGVTCSVLAVALEQPWFAAGLMLTGVGAGVLLARRGGNSDRNAHRREVERSGLPPKIWETPAVEAHLRNLEGRLQKLELAGRARQRAEEARSRAETLETKCEDSKTNLRKVAKTAGITAEMIELGAIQQVQRLVELAKSRTAVTKIGAKCRKKTNSLNGFLRDVGDWLVTLGLEAPSDVAAAKVRISSVGRRLTDWHAAKEEISAKTTERVRALVEVERVGAELSEVWKRTGVEPGDFRGLEHRLEVLGKWKSLREEEHGAVGILDAAKKRFKNDEDLAELDGREPAEVPKDEVEEWINSYGERTAGLEGLNEEKGRIGKELEDAAKGTTFADALARAHDAGRRLAAEREQAAEDAVARLLLDEARDSHEATHVPRVLARAQSLFQGFTHDGWRIEVDRDGSFGALDVAARERRSLDALSDGTRAQLLLAARIAALEELEQGGEQLPICLDEALSNCDPVRFREIAGALLELVADGRQVIYATADPAEAEQWRQACRDLGHPQPATVDLGALRDPSHDWGGALPAVPEVPEPIPDPADKTPEDYARAVGAPPPDGFRKASSWHLYVVAYDDLDALAVCLRRRLNRVGLWREARRTGRTPQGIDDRTAARIDERCAIAEAVTHAWRVGRGRPVTWDDVEASAAVSDRYSEDVRELLANYSRNPEQFVDAVGDIRGFRQAKAEDLRIHLENEGVLPTVAPLAREDLVRRALSGAPNAVESLDPEHSVAYVEWLLDLIETNA